MLILFFLSLLVVGVVYGSGTDNVDRRPVRELDLDRYLGDWYEIARFDHPFERGLVEVHTRYTRYADGRIEVVLSGVQLHNDRRKQMRGKVRTTVHPGRLRVSYFWFFYSDYTILELGEQYEWALVGSRSTKRLWILARTPRLPAHTLNRILRLAERRGYDSGRLLFVDQPAGTRMAR